MNPLFICVLMDHAHDWCGVAYCPRPLVTVLPVARCRHRSIDFSRQAGKWAESAISQYSTVVLTVVRVMVAKYRKSGIWGYRSSLTPEPVELK